VSEALFEVLRRLSETRGPSGHEEAVAAVMEEALGPWVDELRRDALGNVIATKRSASDRRTVMLTAHMDEIGLRVSALRGGFLRWAPACGLDRRALLGKEVTVHGRRELTGVMGARPPHVLSAEERGKFPAQDEMLIDLGLPPEEVEALVRVGDPISIGGSFRELAGGRVSGPALDDRCGIAAIVEAARQLHERGHQWTLQVMATVQEEMGLRGAALGAYEARPDVAIAVDVTVGRAPGVPEAAAYALGEGPAIGWGPNFHPRVFDRLVRAAQREDIPYQVEPLPGRSGTDAWAIQVSGEGIPCGLISAPVRNLHSPAETACLEDLEGAARLLAAFVEGLDEGFASELGLGDADGPR